MREICDVVLAKDKAHGIASMATPGGWRAAQASMVAQELDAVVVGAGQAGLSAAYHMKREGVGSFVVLERAARCGSAWGSGRWDSFRLVTENSLCNLPGFSCGAPGLSFVCT